MIISSNLSFVDPNDKDDINFKDILDIDMILNDKQGLDILLMLFLNFLLS
ncbi:MAG: hypothetical protein ACTSUN_03845 [Promethearchaeota archaeon]